MSKRVGFNVLVQELKQRSGLKNILSAIFATLFVLFFLNTPSYADGPADSVQINDIETNITNVTKQKKVTINGYIGAVGGGGTDYQLAYDELMVISEDPAGTSSLTNLSVSQFTVVTKDGDPHEGMYYFAAKGRPFYDINSNPYRYSIRVCLLAEDHTFAQCTDSIDFSTRKNATLKTYTLTEQYDDPKEIGFYGIDEEGVDEEGSSCLSENGLIGHVFCPIVDGLQQAVAGLYESTIADSLNIQPELLAFDNDVNSMSAGDSVREVWEYFRVLANIIFALLFLVMVISQISGVGISNYGIKKMLSRVVACAVLVNLSYFVCQLAVDLSNILGQSIGDLITNMADNVKIPSVKGASDDFMVLGSLGSIVVVIAGAIYALVTNPALLIPVLLALLSGLIAIFALFVTLGIRRAAVIILIAVSPVAFVCYVLPNTKNIFNKWLNLFKALLMAFPIASIMVYGGLFASKVLLATWGPTIWYSLLGGFAVAVVPYFFIPRVITSSVGKLNAVVARISQNLDSRASRALSQSGIAEGLQARANQNHLDQLAHYRPELRRSRMPGRLGAMRNRAIDRANERRARYNRERPASADRYLQAAMAGHRMDAEHAVRNATPNYVQNSERNMRIREREDEYKANKYDSQQLGSMLLNAHQSGDDIGRAAIMHSLAGSRDGILQMEAFLNAGIHSTEEMASIASVFSQKEIDNMAHMSPFAAAVLNAAKRGENVGTGSMMSYDLTKSGLSFNYSQDYENYSDQTKAQLRADAEHNYDSEFSTQYTRAMEEMVKNPELSSGVTLDSSNNANDYLQTRSNEIDDRVAGLSVPPTYNPDPSALPSFMDGINVSRRMSADLAGHNRDAQQQIYLMGEVMKFAQRGDLLGMEAAVREMDRIAETRISGMTDEIAKARMTSEYSAFMSSAFSKISSPSFTFNNGVSRDAVAGQIALFRSRAQG